MRYHFTPIRMAAIQKSTSNKCWRGVEEREPSYTVGRNANQFSHYEEQSGDSLKKLEIELPYDPAIPPLGIHTKETRIERDMCTPVFIAALFITARTWKQPRCPSADEWIRKLWYIYTMEYYSAIKKSTFESVLMRWMKLEPIIQSEVSQKEKYQYSILTYIYGIQKDSLIFKKCLLSYSVLFFLLFLLGCMLFFLIDLFVLSFSYVFYGSLC